jgi:malonyl CoA-acyl carrier protein transacylase
MKKVRRPVAGVAPVVVVVVVAVPEAVLVSGPARQLQVINTALTRALPTNHHRQRQRR